MVKAVSQICEAIQRKNTYFQIILIGNSDILTLQEKLQFFNLNNENLSISLKNDPMTFFVIDAPQHLGRILKDFKNIRLFNFENVDFISLILHLKNEGYGISNLDFLGYQKFDEQLSESLEYDCSVQNITGIIDRIHQNNLEITKFIAKKGDQKICFYRSGLLYSNFEISKIKDILIPILGVING